MTMQARVPLLVFIFLLFPFVALFSQPNFTHSFQTSALSDSLDALHYRIHIQEIDFAQKSIRAHCQLELVPKQNLETITLELKVLTVDSVNIYSQQKNFSQQADYLHIIADAAYTPADTLLLDVYYHGQPFSEQWGGFHFSGNYAFNLGVGFESIPHNLGKAWFPCIDDFQDRATYEVLISLPEEMTGISGGILADTIHHDNQITWHWKINQAIPTYLISVAAGEYALTASNFSGIEADVPILIYTRPSDTAKVAGTFLHLVDILDIYENRFGPYPFDRIGYTGTAVGAMEHVGNIAYPHSVINGNISNEYLLAHELSHMWFGNQVTCATAEDMWLNEGWATFCHHFYQHDLYSPERYVQEIFETHYDVLRNAHIRDGGYHPLSNIPITHTYGNTAYDKGAIVVHTMMNYMGEDRFFETVKAFLAAFKFQHASSADMREFFTTYSGMDMDAFFDAWVFTAGTPHFSIDSVQTIEQGGSWQNTVYLKQKYRGADFLADNNRFEIGFLSPEYEWITDVVEFSGKHGQLTTATDFYPLMVVVDPHNKMADAVTDQHGWMSGNAPQSFSKFGLTLYPESVLDSVFYHFSHHWAAPDSMFQKPEGLRLSPSRYWELKMPADEVPEIQARFSYNNDLALDAELILTENDSVVILYRPNAGSEWLEIPSESMGLWSVGYLYVDNIQPGQYTLAVWDKTFVGLNEQNQLSAIGMRLYPNPAFDQVRIELDEQIDNAIVVICDIWGRQLHQQNIAGRNSLSIDTINYASGIYFIEIKDVRGVSLAKSKLVVR